MRTFWRTAGLTAAATEMSGSSGSFGSAGLGGASDLGRWARGGVGRGAGGALSGRSEEHTSELQSPSNLGCRLLLEKKKSPRLASGSGSPVAGDHPEQRTEESPGQNHGRSGQGLFNAVGTNLTPGGLSHPLAHLRTR